MDRIYCAGVWSCRWQDHTFLHAPPWLKQARSGYLWLTWHSALTAPVDRETSSESFNMEMLALSSLIFPWPSCSCSHQSLYPCSILEATLNLCSPNCEWPLYFSSRFVSVCFNSPARCLCLWIMVHECGRCRDGGRREGHGRSQPAPSPVIPMAPASPPSEIPQPNCPGSRHFPHNTFQTTHFKFHSRLNKPILSASITVIFVEEEAQSSASVHTSASLSLGGKQSGEDMGNVFNFDNVQVEKGMPEDINQPHGTLQGVLGSVDQACRPFGIRRLVAIPHGSGLKVETTTNEVYLGPACAVVEELKDHGSDV